MNEALIALGFAIGIYLAIRILWWGVKTTVKIVLFLILAGALLAAGLWLGGYI